MESLHRKEAARLTRCRQVFHAWCQFHILMRQGQDGGHLAAPFLIRNPTGLVSERLGTQERNSTGLHRGQNGQHGFRFNPDAWLSLIVTRPLKTTTIKVNSPITVLSGIRVQSNTEAMTKTAV